MANLVNGPVHHESLVAQLVRAPNRYLGGHGFDSRRGLRIFLCPMLVSCRKNPSSRNKCVTPRNLNSNRILLNDDVFSCFLGRVFFLTTTFIELTLENCQLLWLFGCAQTRSRCDHIFTSNSTPHFFNRQSVQEFSFPVFSAISNR